MQIYSNSIVQFNLNCEEVIKKLLTDEVGLRVRRTRFEYAGYFYPIKIRSYRDDRELLEMTLGRFCSKAYTIYLNYDFCHLMSSESLKNLLRHELAHYLIYLRYGSQIQPHGSEYREFCRQQGWGEDIYLAHSKQGVDIQTRLRKKEKIQKLFNLSQSSNPHEAQSALLKAHQLSIQYDLKLYENNNEASVEYFVKTLNEFKRKTALQTALYEILTQMDYALLFHYLNGGIHLECYGPLDLVNQCQTLYTYLYHCLEDSWKIEKKQGTLSGLKAKNSYFQGVASGIITQLKGQKKNYSQDQEKALVRRKKELQKAKALIYSTTSQGYSSGSTDLNAKNIGFKNGQKFNLQFQKHRFLSYSS
ncbi:MAG: DUF2786 domain-containing protein [Halobacteriovoraceae bacterium]|nr:DUF2786 domain-containing protein [Halobacteriovoraceae bacterium]